MKDSESDSNGLQCRLCNLLHITVNFRISRLSRNLQVKTNMMNIVTILMMKMIMTDGKREQNGTESDDFQVMVTMGSKQWLMELREYDPYNAEKFLYSLPIILVLLLILLLWFLLAKTVIHLTYNRSEMRFDEKESSIDS